MGSEKDKAGEKSKGSIASWMVLGLGVVVAAGSVVYNVMGSHGTAPENEAVADAPPTIDELRRRAEASDDDARAWSELGYALYGSGDFVGAASAYRKAAEIEPSEAVLWSALGESLVMASETDPLPAEALKAFETAIELDSTDPRARYFLAVKKDLAKDHEGAISDWLALLNDTPQGAPWETDLVRTIEQVGKIQQIDVAARIEEAQGARSFSGSATGAQGSPSVRGPTQSEVAAASAMRPSEQRDMAVGMVAQLEARLKNEPNNLDGWVMLMRSRITLGEPDKAKAALNAAIKANPSEASELRAQAQQLGLR